MSIPLHKDLGKKAKDLVERGFPSSNKVKLTTKSENGLKFETVVERKSKYAKDGSFERFVGFGSFAPKLELKEYGLKANASLDTEWVKGDVVLSNLFTDGLEATIKTKASNSAIAEASGDLAYKQDAFNLALSLFLKGDDTKISVSSVLGHEGIVIGGAVTYKIGEGDKEGGLDSLNVATGYIAGKYDIIADVSGTYDDNGKMGVKVGSKVLYKHNASTNFATLMSYAVEKAFTEGVTVTAVGEYKFDADTTAKAKANNAGTVGLALTQKLNKNVKVTLGAEFNTLSNADNKFGFELAFDP